MAKKVISKQSAVKAANKTVKTAKAESKAVLNKSQEIVQASVGAVSLIRKRGEKLLKKIVNQGKGLQAKAFGLIENLQDDVREQANGVLAQVKSATASNVTWVSEKAEDAMGKVLNRIGVPSKADVKELSRRVAELHKQVKAMQKAA